MEGLDLLGADTAFANQYITLRIKNIDRDKLADALGGSTGAYAKAGLSLVETSPKAMLDFASPLIKNKAKDYGVDADLIIANVPPTKGGPRALSEFWPGLVAGTVIGGSALIILTAIRRWVRK